jgi:hypothetical protein
MSAIEEARAAVESLFVMAHDRAWGNDARDSARTARDRVLSYIEAASDGP